jgi:hypothetical protein
LYIGRKIPSEDQRAAPMALAGSRDRGEADRARAILLTLSGWTSPRIAEAFSVREDTVRLWRGDLSRGGTDALKASVARGPSPVKSKRSPGFVQRSRRARTYASAARNCPRRCEKTDRIGLRLQLREQQAEAGDIVLLYGDESEALAHPYLA